MDERGGDLPGEGGCLSGWTSAAAGTAVEVRLVLMWGHHEFYDVGVVVNGVGIPYTKCEMRNTISIESRA